MSKTRLNQGIRDNLMRFVRSNYVPEKEQKTLYAAYAKAASLVRASVDNQFAPDEMAILVKHQVARADTCILCVSQAGQNIGFDFNKEDAPMLPNRYCSSRSISVNAKCVKAIEDWELAKDGVKKARQEAERNYRALIYGARNAEAILEVWPAASQILDPFIASRSGGLPAPLDEDALKFIQKSNVAEAA